MNTEPRTYIHPITKDVLIRYKLSSNQGIRYTWAHSKAEARLRYESPTCRVYNVSEDTRVNTSPLTQPIQLTLVMV